MASFQKRGKTWQYTISSKPKPIRKSGFKTKKEAQVAAAEMEARLSKGMVPHLKQEPFDEYFKNWLELYKTDAAKNTIARYKNTLKTLQTHFGGVPIQQITKRQYQAFLNDYAKDHAKESTKKINTHIRACLRTAMDEGITYVDFTRNAVISGNNKTKRPEEKHLNYVESEMLLKELYNRLNKTLTYYLLLLGLTSGMRFAELVGLTRKDFDFINLTITINKTWGYTNKMHEGFGPTKNEESNRTIKIDEKTMDVFKKLFERTPENIYKLVFYSPTSKYRVISNNDANKVLANTLKHLNIDPITVHGLRHTHTSVLLYRGVSVYYVSERLGHKDTETTNKTYAHILKELREKDEQATIDVFKNMVV